MSRPTKLFTLFLFGLMMASCSSQKSTATTQDFHKRKYLSGTHRLGTGKKETKADVLTHTPRKKEKASKTSSGDLKQGNSFKNQPMDSESLSEPLADMGRKDAEIISSIQEKRLDPFRYSIEDYHESVESLFSKASTPKDSRTTHWAAITGFSAVMLGIISLFLGPLAAIGGLLLLLGLIFSAISLGSIKDNPELYKGRGLALAGLITSIVIFALSLIVVLVFLAALNN